MPAKRAKHNEYTSKTFSYPNITPASCPDRAKKVSRTAIHCLLPSPTTIFQQAMKRNAPKTFTFLTFLPLPSALFAYPGQNLEIGIERAEKSGTRLTTTNSEWKFGAKQISPGFAFLLPNPPIIFRRKEVFFLQPLYFNQDDFTHIHVDSRIFMCMSRGTEFEETFQNSANASYILLTAWSTAPPCPGWLDRTGRGRLRPEKGYIPPSPFLRYLAGRPNITLSGFLRLYTKHPAFTYSFP
eukprot:g42456.t1